MSDFDPSWSMEAASKIVDHLGEKVASTPEVRSGFIVSSSACRFDIHCTRGNYRALSL